MKLIDRTSVFYNGKIVTRDDKSLSEIEKKLMFTPRLDYTHGGIINGGNIELPNYLKMMLR